MDQAEAKRQTFDYAYASGRTHVSLPNLGGIIAGLKSEQGENMEYDRALVEVMTEALGLSHDYKGEVAVALGIVGGNRWLVDR